MKHYSLTREDLVSLLQQAYESGCHGYMDLKDSVVESLILDFLQDKNSSSEKNSLNKFYSVDSTLYDGSLYFVSSNFTDNNLH